MQPETTYLPRPHRRPHRRTRQLVAGLTAASLFAVTVAACGSSDDEGTEAAATSVTTATSAPATTATTAAAAAAPTSSTAAPSSTAPATTAAASAASATPAKAVKAAEAFLATLDDTQRGKVNFERTQAKLSAWSNLPDGLFPRDGLRLADLSAAQQQAALAVVQTLLSEDGFRTVQGIMAGDGVLAQTDAAATRLDFGADRYWIRLLGTPSVTTPWTVQFGGHHLAVNVTIAKGQVTMAPSLVAAQPASYTLNGATVRPMAAQTDTAFALVTSLDATQQAAAILPNTLADLFLGAGADGKTIAQEGISASKLTAAQQAQLLTVIGAWLNLLNPTDAAPKLAQAKAELASTTFVWSGPTTSGTPFYYRIQGPTVYIEFAHQQGQGANAGGVTHIHAIYRDLTNDYGRAWIS